MVRIPRPLALLATAALSAVGLAQPKILVSTNQMNRAEALSASRLAADGTWFLGYNSPDVEFALWKNVCRSIGTKTFVSEDGGVSMNYLLNRHMTPQIMLRSSNGKYVSVRTPTGTPLRANIHSTDREPTETFNLWFSPPSSPNPVRPPLGQLPQNGAEICLTNYWGVWIGANGGGMSSLAPKPGGPGPWERLRLYKKVAGDSYLRPGDPVAMQTWNGFFTGGNYVNMDRSNGLLVANGGSLAQSETFTVAYPCEWVTARQIAPVTGAMVYTEYADTAMGSIRNWTLNNAEIDDIAARTGRGSVIVHTRTFENYSELPGVLPTHRQQIEGILHNSNLKGVVFEMEAGTNLVKGEILAGVDKICRAGKEVYFLIPPRANCANYTSDVKTTLGFIRRSPWYKKITLVLAGSHREITKVGFLGGANSVEGAVKWARANR